MFGASNVSLVGKFEKCQMSSFVWYCRYIQGRPGESRGVSELVRAAAERDTRRSDDRNSIIINVIVIIIKR